MSRREFQTVDFQVGGQPFRIVVDGAPELPGASARARRLAARDIPELDRTRLILSREPRGHAEMYGGYLLPPDRADAACGAVFWHTEGYPPSCAHGTLAIAGWAVETGLVAEADGETLVRIDTPAGPAEATVLPRTGGALVVRSEPMRAYPIERGRTVRTALGEFTVDLAFGGAVFASVSAASLGLTVTAADFRELVAVGREIRRALNEGVTGADPEDSRLSGVFGVLFHEPVGATPTGWHERNVNVFNDGWVDRSPCAPGTAARFALLAEEGALSTADVLVHESIVGARYLAAATPAVAATRPGEIEVSVDAPVSRTGEHRFVVEEGDPYPEGFLLRAGPAGPAVPTPRL